MCPGVCRRKVYVLRATQVCDQHDKACNVACIIVTQHQTAWRPLQQQCPRVQKQVVRTEAPLASAVCIAVRKPTRVQGARQQAECGRPAFPTICIQQHTAQQHTAGTPACGGACETAAAAWRGHTCLCRGSASQHNAFIFLVVVQRPFVPWAVHGDGVCGRTTPRSTSASHGMGRPTLLPPPLTCTITSIMSLRRVLQPWRTISGQQWALAQISCCVLAAKEAVADKNQVDAKNHCLWDQEHSL